MANDVNHAESRRVDHDLDRLFYLSVDILAIADFEGNCKRVNPAVGRLLGWTEEEFLGRPFFDFIHPEDRDATRAEIGRVASGSITTCHENRYLCKDGSYRWLAWTSQPVVEEGLIYSVGRDVTDRRHSEQSRDQLLREQAARAEAEIGERRHRALAEAIPQGVWTARPDGWTEYCNRRWCDYAGQAAEQAQGWGWLDVTHPDDVAPATSRWREALARGEPMEQEIRFRRAVDGAYRWHLVRAVPVHGDDGRIERWFGTSTDIDAMLRADKELRISESRFRALVEQSPLSTQVIGADGATLRVNRAWERLWGVTLDQIAGYNILQDKQLEERGIMPYLLSAFGGEGVETPPSLYRPDRGPREGEAIWVRAVIYPVKDEAGAVREVVLVHEDITESVRAEEAVRAGERQLRAVYESSLDAIVLADDEGRYVEANPAACALFGLLRERLIGSRVADFADPESPPDRAWQGFREAGAARGEFRLVRPDGSVRVTDFSATADVLPGRHLSVLRDVTERRRAEEALRDADRRKDETLALLDSLLANAPIGFAFFDRRHRFVRVNEHLAATDGVAIADHLGRPIREVLPAQAPSIEPVLDRVFATGEAVYDLEIEGETPSEPGGRRHWLCGFYPVRTADGQTPWAGAVLTDITGRKRAEAALRKAMESAEAAIRAREQFLAVLSHELRTPLTPVLVGVSALLDDPETPESVRPTLEVARRNIELEARLIDDLLDVTRIRQGKLRLDRTVVDAHDLILQALEICRDEIAAKELRLEVELKATGRHVEADPARLQQIVWNLIKNAAKFTGIGGTLAISTRDENRGGVGPRLILDVRDSGIGIVAEVLPRIFDAFDQGNPQVTGQFGGLGLGLAISRSLADAHGGSLTAASEGGGLGSVFTLELPAVHPPADAVPTPAPSGAERGRVLNILFVEDNPDTLRVMARLLRRSGHRVVTATGVSAALEAMTREGPFELIISDIGLPDGNGMDLMRQIRKGSSTRGIALSGYGMDEDVRRSLEAGFTAHLTKPINFQKLEAAIRRVLATD